MFHFMRELKCVESLLDRLSPLFVPIFYYVNKTALSGCLRCVYWCAIEVNALWNCDTKFVVQNLLE